MGYIVFGGIIVFAGFYLIIKCLIHRKKGIHMEAPLVGFQEEKGSQYPVFRFTYEGEEELDTIKIKNDKTNGDFRWYNIPDEVVLLNQNNIEV